MVYEVRIGRHAAKALEAIPSEDGARLRAKMDALSTDPRPSGCKKLKGHSDTYRIRHGDYRVIYSIDDWIKVVKVEKVGHRKDIYD